MGNSPSSAERGDGVMLDGTSSQEFTLAGHRERERGDVAAADASQALGARHGASSTPRIRVDIRGHHLEDDYVVHVRREPRRELDSELRSVWSGMQAVGTLLITVLTVQKLWEDIRFIRLLRRELSSLVGSLANSGGADDGADGARPPRQLGAAPTTRRPAAPSAPPLPPASPLDLDLSDLSSMLDKVRGAGGARPAAETSAPEAASAAAAAAAPGTQKPLQQQGEREAAAAGAEHQEIAWASISGLTDVKILLQEATVLPTLRPDLFQGIRQPPKALLLFGPPGTGKTMLARAVAAESRATFLPVTGSSVLSMWYGQSEQNVKALFEKARRRQPAIIFIDEVDSLLGKRSGGGPRDSTPDKRVTNEFLAFIDGIQTQQAADTRIMVVAATNTPWDLDEAALSRFSRRIYVPLPDKATRESLMRKALEGLSCEIGDEEWQRLAERCDKYSGRDLVQVCREAAMRPLRELWGRRLLEGSAAVASAGGGAGTAPQHSAAHERLVDLVAKSLAGAAAGCGHRAAAGPAAAKPSSDGTGSGTGAVGRLEHGAKRRWQLFGFNLGDRYARSKRQARRELERWKRRHHATWCDVDLVMQQADRRVQARRQAAAPRAPAQQQADAQKAGSEASPRERPDVLLEQQRGQQQQQEESRGDGGQGATPEAAALPAAVPDVAAAEAPARDARSEGTPDGESGPPPAPAPAQDGEQARAGANERACGEGRDRDRSGEEGAAAVAVAAGECGAPDAAAGPAPIEPRLDAAPAPATAAGDKGAAPAGSSTSPRGGATGSAPPGAAGAAAGPAAAGGGPIQSLEELLSLPTASVRPVLAADIEAALRVISNTEMDQSARYMEWDEQYGSGATSGAGAGGRGKVWMSMYV